MPDSSFTILGSSSGLPQANRACSGYLLKVGESLNLIDCGGGVCQSFLRQGFDPIKLDRVFISHTHSDHVCELTLVIQMLHVLGSKRELEIYLPDEFLEPFKAWLNAVYMFPERVNPELRIDSYLEGVIFDGEFKVTVYPNNHHKKAAETIKQLGLSNKMQCNSLRFDAKNGSVFYSADVGSFEDIRPHLINLDYAIVESTHIDLNDFFEFARNSDVKNWILTHLGNEEEVAELKSKISDAGLTNVVTAEDGMTLAL